MRIQTAITKATKAKKLSRTCSTAKPPTLFEEHKSKNRPT